MSFKTILVHVDPSPDCDRRVRLAQQVADLFGGSVTGLGAEAFGLVPATGYAAADGAVLEAARQRIAIDLPAAEEHFRILTAGRKGDRWLACEDYPARMLTLEARGADLIVAGRPVHGEGSTFAAKPAELIMEAGGPVLMAADRKARFSGEHVVVAWKYSRESRRALADSLPFLMRAQGVSLVGVTGDSAAPVDQAGMADVVRRLARHGVEAVIDVVSRGRGTVAAALDAAADRHAADLIVVGAYGHSRLREWALGGVTEELIAASSKFVLFSH
jgi:nucleotide-binding universal stress UspA family protein